MSTTTDPSPADLRGGQRRSKRKRRKSRSRKKEGRVGCGTKLGIIASVLMVGVIFVAEMEEPEPREATATESLSERLELKKSVIHHPVAATRSNHLHGVHMRTRGTAA